MLESAIRARGVENLKKQGWDVTVLHGTAFSGRGRADTVICAEGLFAWVEWKTADGQATPIQLHRLGEIRRAGGISFICDAPDLVVSAIRAGMNGEELPVEVRKGRWPNAAAIR